MGTFTVTINDKLETELRTRIARSGGKKGDLSLSVEAAICDWVSKKPNTESVRLDVESWGLVCDAIEIAIGESDFNRTCNERFAGMVEEMKELVAAIEKQSGCQTKEE